MAKKKVDEPFFLTFINLPFNEIPYAHLFDKTNINENSDQDFWTDLSMELKPQMMDIIGKRIVEQVKEDKPFASNTLKLGELRYRLDKGEVIETQRVISQFWKLLHIVDFLIYLPKGEVGKTLMWHENESVLQNATPAFRWKSDGSLGITFLPRFEYPPVEENEELIVETRRIDCPGITGPVTMTSRGRTGHKSFSGLLGIEFAQFLADHYKPGIFLHCKLDGCEKIIITANGRKYCCRAHGQKANLEIKKKNKDQKEYMKIRNTLYKQYKARTYLQKKWSLEESIRNNWPKGKRNLYNQFARAAK